MSVYYKRSDNHKRNTLGRSIYCYVNLRIDFKTMKSVVLFTQIGRFLIRREFSIHIIIETKTKICTIKTPNSTRKVELLTLDVALCRGYYNSLKLAGVFVNSN